MRRKRKQPNKPGGLRCTKCHRHESVTKLSKHHVYPQRWFGPQKGTGFLIILCLDCHQQGIEIIYRHFEFGEGNGVRTPLPKRIYRELCSYFIGGQFDKLLRQLKGGY